MSAVQTRMTRGRWAIPLCLLCKGGPPRSGTDPARYCCKPPRLDGTGPDPHLQPTRV